MTQSFFNQQMKLIIDTFGPVEYPPPKKQAIWDECKDLPDHAFAKIVKHFIWTKPVKYPPLPTHFFEEAIGQRKLLNQKQEAPRETTPTKEPEDSAAVLKRVLERMGASSIQDAINKQRGKQHEPTSDSDL